MKKLLQLLLLSLLICGIPVVQAQSGCDLYIDTDFDSECLLTQYLKEHPELAEMDLSDCMLACKKNTVTYTAVCPNGVQFSWNVTGATSYYHPNNQGHILVVTWGNNDEGHISVNVITSDSNTCTVETCVLLMESPIAKSTTVPYYHIDQQNGDKVIELCVYDSVQLTDISEALHTPITGCYWSTHHYGTSSAQSFSFSVTDEGVDTIWHYVQNECGCEDVEYIVLRVKGKSELKLSCYGTVCEDTIATYTLEQPYCAPFVWYVEGGTIVQGQNSPTITVQWGHPSTGYGIISIDASMCEDECPALVSVKIPIISENTEISGPDVICVGDIQQYGLPLWGSTYYHWTVSPWSGNDVEVNSAGSINQTLVKFKQTGNYTITAQYGCEFLDCGPFTTSKNIVVKDTMSIRSSDHTLCKGATGTYTTWHGNSVTWRVYNQNNMQIHYSNGTALNYTFANAGNYKVVASGNAYCEAAEYLVTVLDNPPALTTTNGPHDACPGSYILLDATPTHPNYYLVWEPLCSTATPSSAEGDEVTIHYGNNICGVAVYQVDKEYNCRSNAYIHDVVPFTLAPSGLPLSMTKCAGDIFSQTVPFQDNVLYEWTISPAGVASIQGDHLSNNVTFLVNHLVGNQSTTAVVTLKRTYCAGSVSVESFTLNTLDAPVPTISYTTPICQGDYDNFSVTSTPINPSHYTWYIDGTSSVGTSTSHLFTQPGEYPFTLNYQPYPICPAIVVSGTVEVVAPPVVVPYFDGQNVAVVAYPNASYSWSLDGYPQPSSSNLCTYTTTGTYCCTVTYNSPSTCYTTGCITIDGIPPIPMCDDVIMPCSSSVACNVANIYLNNLSGGNVTWSVVPQIPGNIFTSQSNNFASITFRYPGVYTVIAEATVGGLCYHGETPVTIECVPDFSLTRLCNGQILFEDKSLYRTTNSIVSQTLYFHELNQYFNINSIPLNALQPGITNHVDYIINFSSGQQCQITKTFTVDALPSITGLNVSQYMCEGIPFLFSANATGSTFYWNFGDGTYHNGNNIYHTFNNYYTNVTLVVANADGCVATMSQPVTIVANMLQSGQLLTTLPNMVCPNYPRQIEFSIPAAQNDYCWNNLLPWVSNYTYTTFQTGDYHVLVSNNIYGCKKESTINVGFLNAPTAKITGNTEYCLGEEVKLFGNTGANNQYSWTITGPLNDTKTTPNITFTPTVAGTYNITLTVTSPIPDLCTDVATTTVTVHPQPAAPSIAFNGNECIHTPPVEVQCTSGQSLLWSNGHNGVTAEYYVPGYLSAYYIDPTTGCPSAKETFFIPPAPNYDALLTGCYERCKEELPTTLPVYNFYPYNSYPEFDTIHWDWYENNSWCLGGSSIYATLPINGIGSYYMNTQYGNGCVIQSPHLDISEKEICPCKDIEIIIEEVDCFVEECNLRYHMTVVVCNNSSQYVKFDQFYINSSSTIVSTYPDFPLGLDPWTCKPVEIDIQFLDFENGCVTFTLYDAEHNCEVTFMQCFDWEKCVKMDGCDIEKWTNKFNEELSTHFHATYFDFELDLPGGVSSIVALWSEPPQVFHYAFNPPSYANGLLMFSYGKLTQMVANDEEICLNIIMCIDDSYLCYDRICMPAVEFLEMIPEDMRQFLGSPTADNDTTRSFQSSSFIPQADKPYLAPNPARDEVTVMGIAPEEVAEITVLTMQGGQVADYRNDYRFNVSRLAKASYIVRVITTNKQVYYLKLVKQ